MTVMTDDLQQARVDAAGRVMYEYWDDWEIEDDDDMAKGCRQLVSDALAAADAVVTVEMIAETAHKAMQESYTDSEEYEHAPAYIARAVLALIRGGGEQC